MSLTYTPPDTASVERGSSALAIMAKALTIHDSATADEAGRLLVEAGQRDAQVVALFAEPKRLAHAAHKSLCALESRVRAGPLRVMEVVTAKLTDWLNAKRRARELTESILRTAARRHAEEDRLREAEHVAVVHGDAAGLAILDRPVVPASIMLAAPKIEGVVERHTVAWELTDAALLPREYLMPNERAIDARVRTLGLAANIPGVRTWLKTSVVRKQQ